MNWQFSKPNDGGSGTQPRRQKLGRYDVQELVDAVIGESSISLGHRWLDNALV